MYKFFIASLLAFTFVFAGDVYAQTDEPRTVIWWQMGGSDQTENSVDPGSYTLREAGDLVSVPGVAGDAGGAYYFDGDADYLSFEPYEHGTNDFTIDAWINPEELDQAGGASAVFAQEESNARGNPRNSIYVRADGRVSCSAFSNEERQDVVSNAVVEVNTWTYITCSRENGIYKLYLDGELDETAQYSFNTNISDFTGVSDIGRRYNAIYSSLQYFFKGTIDEVRVANYARSEIEISEYYEQTKPTGVTSRPNLLTQTVSPYPSVAETTEWADDYYADADATSGYWCGSTIAGCGCAITSMAMLGRSIGVTEDVLGGEVNPGNMNEYLQSVGGYTGVGSIKWLAGSAYLGKYLPDGRLATRLGEPVFAAGSATMSEIDAAFMSGNKGVIAYDKRYGHFVWLKDKTEDSYQVYDPLWYNTVTANDTAGDRVRDYNNSFDEARILPIYEEYEPLEGMNIEAHVLSNTAQLLFTSATGEQVGYAGGEIVIDLGAAHYGDIAIIDPEQLSDDSPGKHLLVYDAGDEFTLEVVGTDFGEYTLEFFTLDETGNITQFEVAGNTYPGVKTTFVFDPETGSIVEQPLTEADIKAALKAALGDQAVQVQNFFARTIFRLYEKTDTWTASQLSQQLEVLNRLLEAKKVAPSLKPKVIDLAAALVTDQLVGDEGESDVVQ